MNHNMNKDNLARFGELHHLKIDCILYGKVFGDVVMATSWAVVV